MVVARGLPEGPTEWAWLAGIMGAYLAISYLLAYRARRRRGASGAARDALHDLGDRRPVQPPGQYLASRMIMLGGALVTGVAGFLTSGAVRVAVVVVVGLLAIALWAYFDHRTGVRSSQRAE